MYPSAASVMQRCSWTFSTKKQCEHVMQYAIAEGVLLLLTLGYLCLALGAGALIGRSLEQRVGIFLTFLAIPFVWFFFEKWRIDNLYNDRVDLQNSLVKSAVRHLESKCKTEERFTAEPGFRLDGGILVSAIQRGDLDIEKDAPPVRFDAQTIAQRERFFYPPTNNREQFGDPIALIYQFTPEFVQRASGLMSIEFEENGPNGTRYFSRKPIIPWGRDSTDGLSHVQYETQPIAEPRSAYVLSVKDISTVEDRVNWVSGVQVRLIDRVTKRIAVDWVTYIASTGMVFKRGGDRWSSVVSCSDLNSNKKREEIVNPVLPTKFFDQIKSFKPI